MLRRRTRIDLEILRLPEWLEAIDDVCLRRTLSEALIARGEAVQFGAMQKRRAKGEIASGDRTVEQIASGRYTGEAACKRAADALRKYTHALDLAAANE